MTQSVVADIQGMINNNIIPDNCLNDFKRAMKTGYYKMMKQKGLISDSQFEILMQMQSEKKSA